MKRPAITPKMRLKVFQDFGAIVCCQAEGCDAAIYIKEAELDHHLALVDGGKHETGNLRPICSSCHRKKSAREHRNNAKAKRLAKAHAEHQAVLARVMKRPAGKIRSRGFDKRLRKKMNGQTERRT